MQTESLPDGLEVGQGDHVSDVGEIERVSEVRATLPQLVATDGFGVAEEDGFDVGDQGRDTAAHATEFGLTSMHRIYGMVGLDGVGGASFDRLRMSG